MSINNTAPEMYDERIDEEIVTQEDLLMNEHDILAGLLELGQHKNEESSYRKIQIRRKGKLMLEFRIRPISEDETQICLRNATKYEKPKGQPKRAIETNNALFRSYLIYTATVNEDRAKVWDNKKALESLRLMYGVEMIDKVLFSGEKDYVLDVIDDISGFEDEAMITAKN